MSVHTKPIKRQQVSISWQICCDETVSALKVYPDEEINDQTVRFIVTIIEFWKIVNAHNLYANIVLLYLNRVAIRTLNDKNFQKLNSSIIIEVIRTVLNFLCFFTIRFHKYKKAFFYQYHLKADLMLYTYIFIYLKATIKNSGFFINFII